MASLEAGLDWRKQRLRDEWIAYSVLILWLLWIALPFYGISMTTQDQLDFSLAGTAPDYWQEVWNAAVSQGRIYFLFTKSIDHFVAAYPELLAIKLVNWSTFLLSVMAFSYIVFRSLAHGVLFVWVFFCLVWIGYAHQPPAAYPLVNHVPFLLLALTTFAIRRAAVSERRRPLWWGMTFFCSFLSFFQYEPLTAFALVVLLWVIYSGDTLSHHCRLRAYQTVLIAFLLYLSLYVIWSVSFPSNYDGAERGTLSLVTLFRVWVAYTLGAVTGLAGVTFDTQLLWGDSDIGVANLHYGRALLDQSDRIFTLLFTVLAAVLVYRLLKSSCMENQGQSRISYLMKVWVFVVLALGALNGPIALSAKYQSWADSWVEPYLTSHLALYPLVFLIVTTLIWVVARFKQWAAMILAAFLFILGSSGVLMHQQNQTVAIKMRTFVNKWEAISMVAECRDQLLSEDYIAPQFYYSTYQKALDWHRYWRQYASQRYGVSVNLWAQASDTFNPALSIYQDDWGRLQMVAVQSEHEFHVLGTGRVWPNLFLGQSGR
ncbi:MAG: hypothetical protein MI864_09015 [Pseudomonadales bacterium]|nr:hypothetical protein [Pseudomonadales bacterium]